MKVDQIRLKTQDQYVITPVAQETVAMPVNSRIRNLTPHVLLKFLREVGFDIDENLSDLFINGRFTCVPSSIVKDFQLVWRVFAAIPAAQRARLGVIIEQLKIGESSEVIPEDIYYRNCLINALCQIYDIMQ